MNRDTFASMRRRPDRFDAVVGIAAVLAVSLLVWMGLGLTFFADEWAIIADRAVTLEDLVRPFNEHWLAVTIVVYRGLLGLVGMDSYVPYLALLAVLHATVAILVYGLVRRRTLPLVAVGIALIVLLFGSGFENLFWGAQIGFVGATALGLGALLLLDDLPTLPGARRAIAATGLVTIAVMTSGYGLFMLGLVGLDVLLDGRRRRWIAMLALPAGLYVLWYVTLGRSGIATYGNPFTPETVAALPRFIADGMATAFGAAAGGGALVGRILSVALLGWIAYLAAHRRTIPRRAVACLLAIVAEYIIVGIVRAQLEVDASLYTRYAYLSGMLALIGAASLIGRPTIPAERRPVVVAAGVAVLAFSLAWNVALLVGGRALYAERADLTRAFVTLGTTDPLPPGVDPRLNLVLVPSPVELRRVIATYGSPMADALAPGSVPHVSNAALEEATRRAQDPPDWLLALQP
ncbi:MAG: hypothetical protein A2Z32_02475 [Chloroflexi bacterium RBG_16_69_14]|nr:MAG: hypothetical protein A2Z32_02475 [Chloroflexi bacterium RBG_16_69_14]